jgi:putative transcriptional regulator
MSDEYDPLMYALTGILAHPTSSDLPVPSVTDVQAIRKKTGLSQVAFALRIGVPVATLRNWEQGHRTPTGPARVLLALLDRNPPIVEETLRADGAAHQKGVCCPIL